MYVTVRDMISGGGVILPWTVFLDRDMAQKKKWPEPLEWVRRPSPMQDSEKCQNAFSISFNSDHSTISLTISNRLGHFKVDSELNSCLRYSTSRARFWPRVYLEYIKQQPSQHTQAHDFWSPGTVQGRFWTKFLPQKHHRSFQNLAPGLP